MELLFKNELFPFLLLGIVILCWIGLINNFKSGWDSVQGPAAKKTVTINGKKYHLSCQANLINSDAGIDVKISPQISIEQSHLLTEEEERILGQAAVALVTSQPGWVNKNGTVYELIRNPDHPFGFCIYVCRQDLYACMKR